MGILQNKQIKQKKLFMYSFSQKSRTGKTLHKCSQMLWYNVLTGKFCIVCESLVRCVPAMKQALRVGGALDLIISLCCLVFVSFFFF